MALFRFGLEKVLEHRRRLVDLRARDLAAAESRAAALAARIAAVRAEQERCSAGDGGDELDVAALAARTAWVARLDRVIAGLGRERTAALAAVASARTVLQEAWRDREVLAQLRQRRQAEWQLERNRREQAELDEIGGLRHGRSAANGTAG